MRLPAALLAPLAAAGLVLAGCQSPPPEPTFPEIGFAHEQTLRLDVGSIQVVDDYRPTLEPPYVDHLFPQPPDKVAERWAKERLLALGGPRRAVVTITDASVKEVQLPRTGGIKGAFTTDQTQRYDARVAATVAIFEPDGRRSGYAEAEATRSTTVSEDATLAQREQIWFQMTEQLMDDFDAEMTRQIKGSLGSYLK
ncbi:hypothetical protein SAMN06265365_102301 [Tistlia consotensis]|uniref:Lipoprotein n=1 Tax=Tistlia consotensis USBA 355 TaxID=560819 RepID=A0A1Y6BJI1_9PROT|nr:hypothetical protein [Tistlia consotensis]SMF06919.1 hypothetical protein SAMN05428998_10415 [Tistlia consotensis USBA 355]SNR36213.1 hypothetical protein SAMN06265365_102301 [Tistlia consotensis]